MNKEEVLNIAIKSLPETAVTWIDVLSALLTPAVALIAIYIAYQQHKINEQRLRHETYERRLKVYKSVQKHLSVILRDGKTTFQECIEFYSEASEAAFLFDSSVMARIDKIYKNN
jgi:predicted cation transporter